MGMRPGDLGRGKWKLSFLYELLQSRGDDCVLVKVLPHSGFIFLFSLTKLLWLGPPGSVFLAREHFSWLPVCILWMGGRHGSALQLVNVTSPCYVLSPVCRIRHLLAYLILTSTAWRKYDDCPYPTKAGTGAERDFFTCSMSQSWYSAGWGLEHRICLQGLCSDPDALRKAECKATLPCLESRGLFQRGDD